VEQKKTFSSVVFELDVCVRVICVPIYIYFFVFVARLRVRSTARKIPNRLFPDDEYDTAVLLLAIFEWAIRHSNGKKKKLGSSPLLCVSAADSQRSAHVVLVHMYNTFRSFGGRKLDARNVFPRSGRVESRELAAAAAADHHSKRQRGRKKKKQFIYSYTKEPGG